jgi:hypothetical protein
MGEKERLSALFQAKRMTVQTSLIVLGASFEMASKWSDALKEEIKDWEDGRVISVGVLPDGPYMSVKKESGQLRYLGKGPREADLKIMFKNMEVAFLLLTGMMGAVQAFAEHRAIVHGSIEQAMEINRAMAIVQKYLFPGFLLSRLMKRPPTYTLNDWLCRVRINLMLGPALVLNLAK